MQLCLQFTEHSDLGRVVHAIVRELSRTPVVTIGSPPSAPSTAPQQQPQVFSDQNEQSMLRSALASLSVAQLQALKESEDHCDEFLEQLPPIKILEDEIERIVSENVQMASKLLLSVFSQTLSLFFFICRRRIITRGQTQ
jgi:hypothetical protein